MIPFPCHPPLPMSDRFHVPVCGVRACLAHGRGRERSIQPWEGGHILPRGMHPLLALPADPAKRKRNQGVPNFRFL